MSLLGLLTGVWNTNGSLGMVKTNMPIPNVDDNIKPTTLRDLINSQPPESLTTNAHWLYTLGEGS